MARMADVWDDNHTMIRSDTRVHQVIEMVVCISFLIIAYWWDGGKVFDRQTPYQYLATTNAYVRDLSHDEHLNSMYLVDNSSLHILAIFLPLLLQTAWSLLLFDKKHWFDELHAILSCTCFALALNTWITYAIKCYVGYLRPVYYDYCVPFDDYHGCTLDKSFVHVSFPSSHSSLSFCGLTILALFLDRTWRQYISRSRWNKAMSSDGTRIAMGMDHPSWNLLQATALERLVSLLCVMMPLALAMFIGGTRIYNNYHYPVDVMTGAVLGSAIAIFCHGLWFDQGRVLQLTQIIIQRIPSPRSELNVVSVVVVGDREEGTIQ